MLERIEYYWQDGRIVEFVNHRKDGRAHWPKSSHDPSKLVLIVARDESGNQIYLGHAQTPERVAEAILRFSRLSADSGANDIGSEVPQKLLDEVISQAKTIAEKVSKQWESCGNEEGQSGFLTGLINSASSFRLGEWEATIRFQVFSPQTKEPKVGADIGVIIDLRRGKDRSVKGALIQAKRTESVPTNPLNLPDIGEQLAKMQQYTKESYGLIYSPSETFVFSPNEPQTRIAVGEFLTGFLHCNRGDRRAEAVAQAYDRSFVIDITIATGAV